MTYTQIQHNLFCNKHLTIQNLIQLFESSYDGIMLASSDGTILIANQAYAKMMGVKQEMLIGKTLQDLMAKGMMKESAALMVLEEKVPITIAHKNLPGGNALVTGNPVFNETGEIDQVVVNVRDMTEIYSLQRELEKAQEMEEIYYQQLKNEQGNKLYKGPIAVSPEMKHLLSVALKISPVDVTVLITGESGVGKEVVARYIHDHSSRSEGQFITINCGAIPEHLLESELFGYVEGAFTGALKNGKIGLFEAAQDGTIFLDEIGELPPNLQVKILRVLETHEVKMLGSNQTIPVNARILAATNRDLEGLIEKEKFREDLYYRLNVVQIHIPPLRERPEDIHPLAMHFLKEFNLQYHESKRIIHEVLEMMQTYSWPGNTRELRNSVEHMVVISHGDYLETNDLPFSHKQIKNNMSTLSLNGIIPLTTAVEEVEKTLLQNAREKYGSYRKMADALGINHSTVIRKMQKYGLKTHN